MGISLADLRKSVREEYQSASVAAAPCQTLFEQYPPNSDPQRLFLETTARIAVIGGSAGGGKTIAEFLDVTRHVDSPDYGAIIFRRTLKMHKDEGGLWDKSMNLFPLVGGKPNISGMFWNFPSGAAIQFAGLENEESKLNYQGAEIPKIVFDELTHFLESQFFYLISRNRWPAKALKDGKQIPATIRASTNPGPGWVKRLLAPWVDRTFPNRAVSGEIRWFVRENEQITWIDGEPPERGVCVDGPNGEGCYLPHCLKCFPPEISITFIRASVYDNRDLLKANPDYVTGLKNLPEVDRKRLLDGDWDAQPTNLLIDAFDPTRHVISGLPKDRINDTEWLRYVGADFGLHNTAEVFVGREKHTGRLIVYDEDWPGHSRTFEQWGSDVKRLARGPITDGAGGNRTGEQGWRQSIRKEGIPMCEPSKEFADPGLQYQCVNDAFKADELFVLEGCTKLIDMIGRLCRKIDPKTGEVTDDFDDSAFHLPAALRSIITLLRPPQFESKSEPKAEAHELNSWTPYGTKQKTPDWNLLAGTRSEREW